MAGFENLLLIQLHTKVGYGARRPPIGLGYLSQALVDGGVKHEVVDCNLGYTLDDLIAKAQQMKPGLIGISMVTLDYINSYEIIEKLREAYDCPIIVGGPHPSTLRQDVLEACPAIDFAAVGEGEKLIIDLCGGVAPEDIDGLIYRRDDEIVFNPPSKNVLDINAISFPKFEAFELEKYFGFGHEIGILTSRGCPYGCTFCSVHLIMGARIRLKMPNNVADEIAYWHNRGYRRMVILDDNFSQDRERVFDICNELEKREMLDLQISLANGLRADKVDREMLVRMKELGAYEIQIGVESSSDHMLHVIKKGESFQTIEEAVDLSIELGYEVGVNFLVGYVKETWEDVQNSFKWVRHRKLGRAYFFNIIPYPGTHLFGQIEEHGTFLEDPEVYLGRIRQNTNEPVFETPELNLAQRKKLLKQSVLVSEGVRRRFLAEKFKKLWIFAWPAAFLASWHVTEPLLKRNRIINETILPQYYKLIGKGKKER